MMNDNLSRREREIMDIVLMGGESTAEEVRRRLSGAPSYSTTRTLLRRLEAKGYLRHREDGPRYVYVAAVSRSKARSSAVKRLVQVFYEGSFAKAVTGLVQAGGDLSDEDLDAIEEAIAAARPRKRRQRK